MTTEKRKTVVLVKAEEIDYSCRWIRAQLMHLADDGTPRNILSDQTHATNARLAFYWDDRDQEYRLGYGTVPEVMEIYSASLGVLDQIRKHLRRYVAGMNRQQKQLGPAESIPEAVRRFVVATKSVGVLLEAGGGSSTYSENTYLLETEPSEMKWAVARVVSEATEAGKGVQS